MSERSRKDEGWAGLIERAQAGEAGAFDTLVERCRGRIHRWALVRTGDPDAAEDVAQDALVKLHRYLPRFDGRARFTTWLYHIVRTAAAESRRRETRLEAKARRLHREVGADASVRDLADRAEIDDRRAADLVRAFFEELPERQRQAFDLVDLQGFDTVEAAAMLEVKPVTVRTHLLRARRTIRERVLETHPELVEGYGP